MAIEVKRGCGFRKVGGLYLVGDYINISCDRLPFPLTLKIFQETANKIINEENKLKKEEK